MHRFDRPHGAVRSVAQAVPRRRRLKHFWTLPRRRPASFWVPLLGVCVVGVVAVVAQCLGYHATAKVICRVNADVARTVWPDWAQRLELDEQSVRAKLLTSDNLVAAIRQARSHQASGWLSMTKGVPAVETAVRQLRDTVDIHVSRLDDSMSVLSIELSSDRPALATAIVGTLAETYVRQVRAGHHGDVDQALRAATSEVADCDRRIVELQSMHRRKQLEKELYELEVERQSIAGRLLELPQSEDGAAPSGPSSKVSQKWQPIVELERELSQMNLSNEERKRMARRVEQLRRNAALAMSEQEEPAAPPSLLTPPAHVIERAELVGRLQACDDKIRPRRAELQTLGSHPSDPALTIPAIDQQITELRARAAAARDKCDRLADSAALAAKTVEYELEPAAFAVRADLVRLGAYLAITLLAGILAGFCVARLRDGADTSFHSIDEARHHLHLSILGAVPVPDRPQSSAYRK